MLACAQAPPNSSHHMSVGSHGESWQYNSAQPYKSRSCSCYLSTDQRKLVIASNILSHKGRKEGKREIAKGGRCVESLVFMRKSAINYSHSFLRPSSAILCILTFIISISFFLSSSSSLHIPPHFSHHDTPSRPHGPHRTHHCSHQRLFQHHRGLEFLG